MDIGYTTSSGYFSLRSAALVINDNRLLVAKSDKYGWADIKRGGNPIGILIQSQSEL